MPRRPDRGAIGRRVARQVLLPAPVGVHDVASKAVAVADEGDPPPVRRPGGTPSCAGFRVRFRFPLPSAFMT